MEMFDINNTKSVDIIESEPDLINLEINQSKFKSKFTSKEWLAISLYMIDGNCIRSYKLAAPGASIKQARAFFKQINVISEIKRRISIIIHYNKNLIHRIMKEYESLAFSNIDDFAIWNTSNIVLKDSALISRDSKAAIISLTPTRYGPAIKMHSKKDALDSISKIIGILRDSIDLTSVDNSDVLNNSKPVVILPSNKRG